MKELAPHIQKNITYIVDRAETRYINELFAWETSAKHRSENCKCSQCVKEPKRASAAIAEELNRITPRLESEIESEEQDPYGDYNERKRHLPRSRWGT